MRGVVSAGMALALDELGVVPAFDAVYGASAGAISGAWLLSRPDGLRGWTDPAYSRALIRRSAMLRGRPVADVRALVEELYQTDFPMDFAAVLGSPIEFHPLATDAATGQSTDLRPFISDPASLRLALRSSAALPLLAGPPVRFAGHRFYDAGISESVPYRTALAQGATHVLVLRSRLDPQAPLETPGSARPPRRAARLLVQAARLPAARTLPPPDPSQPVPPRPDPPLAARLFVRTALRRESPALRATFLGRDIRLAAGDRLLADYESGARSPSPPDGSAVPPAVMSIRPAPGSPEVSRLATDGALLQAALEAGHAAALAVFPPAQPA
jgi:predicted acylesterase/phospholipase RssA